jgi:hypothetical protein
VLIVLLGTPLPNKEQEKQTLLDLASPVKYFVDKKRG